MMGESILGAIPIDFVVSQFFTQLITPNALRVQTPPRSSQGMVEVSLLYKNRPFCKHAPGRFAFTCTSFCTANTSCAQFSDWPVCIGRTLWEFL